MSVTPHTSPAPIESWEVLDLLTSLVQKSLVVYEEQDGKGRYRLLETIRQYGQEKLEVGGAEGAFWGPGPGEEAVAARDRHRDWYLALAEQTKRVENLEADRENLGAALQWCMQRSDAEAALRLGVALMFFWWTRSLREGRERLAAALALPGAEAPTAARAGALSMAGALAWRQGDYQGGRELTEGSLAIGRQLGDQHRIGGSLNNLGIFALAEGDYERARALLEESLAIARQIGHQEVIADSLDSLGRLARHQGDYEGARALLEESLAVWRRLEDRGGIAYGLEGLAAVARSQGDYEGARALYKESLGIFRPTGEHRGIAAVLEGLAGIAADGQVERAARLFVAAEALRAAIATPLAPGERADYDRYVAATHAALGEEAFAAGWVEGRAMSVDQAITSALEGETLPSVSNRT